MRQSFETANCANYGMLKMHALKMRQNPTSSELCLWENLKDLPIRFRRQYIIGDYIADFLCLKKKLIIEVDGGYHFVEGQLIKDAQRTERLKELGFTVLRFTNEQVLFDTECVIEEITKYINE